MSGPTMYSNRQTSTSKTSLRRKTLVIWQALWVLVAVFDLGVLIYSYPAFILQQFTLCHDPTRVICGQYQLVPSQIAALARFHLTLNAYAIYTLALDSVITLAFLLVGALIFWHRSRDRMGLFVSLLLITFGCFGLSEVHINALVTVPVPVELFGTLVLLFQWPALGLFFCLFPDGRFIPRWAWLLVFLFVIQFGAYAFVPYPYDVPHWPVALQFLLTLLVYGSTAGTQIYRYFAVATPLQRQQIKWLAFGFASTLLLSLLGTVASELFPALNQPDSLAQLGEPLSLALSYSPIPLSIGIALLRYRLWDIDTLINRTLVYGLLTAILLGLYIGLIFGGQALLAGVLGLDNTVVLVASTLAIAALFLPLRRSIQTMIDRRFYRYKYNAERTLASFSTTLHNEVELAQLEQQLINVIEETMHPAHISLWLRPLSPRESTLEERPY
ncbi:MAG TPA: hypothetical protein VHD63_05305 [Ktedonobacteraceae bacterium]|nr:hypothetical protein [Ktedonobacteraceae bacterium]